MGFNSGFKGLTVTALFATYYRLPARYGTHTHTAIIIIPLYPITISESPES